MEFSIGWEQEEEHKNGQILVNENLILLFEVHSLRIIAKCCFFLYLFVAAESGLLHVSASGMMRDSNPVSAIVGRETVRCVTASDDNAWFQVQLGNEVNRNEQIWISC